MCIYILVYHACQALGNQLPPRSKCWKAREFPPNRAGCEVGSDTETKSTREIKRGSSARREAQSSARRELLRRGKLETQSKPRLRRDAPRGRRAASCYRGQDEMTSGSSASDAVEALPGQARDAVKMPRRFRRDTSVIIEPRAPHVLP